MPAESSALSQAGHPATDVRDGGVLLFGAGTMGRVHAQAWQRLGIPVVCVVEPRADAGQALAETVGAHHCIAVAEARTRHADVPVADVCVPTFAHRDLLVSLPPGPRLVVLEKPVERTPAQAASLLADARERGLSVFVAQVVRFFPAYRTLHDRILAEGADTVHHVRLRRIGPPPHGIGDWFLDESLSGGIFLDLLIHDLDFCLWTFGPPDHVIARVSQPVPVAGARQPASRHAVAILAYEGRRVVHVEGSWMDPGPFRTHAEVDASWGTLVLDSEREQTFRIAHQARNGAGTGKDPALSLPAGWPDTTGRLDPYMLELQAAVEAYQAGEPLPVSPDEAERAVILADLCRRAAQTGEPMSWPHNPGSPALDGPGGGTSPCV